IEQDDGEVAVGPELEADLRPDPFLGSVDDLPEHAPSGLELEDLHVEAANLPEAEADRAAGVRVALGGSGPPAGKAFERGQCFVRVVGVRLDVDLLHDVRHGSALGYVLWEGGALVSWTVVCLR